MIGIKFNIGYKENIIFSVEYKSHIILNSYQVNKVYIFYIKIKKLFKKYALNFTKKIKKEI